MKKIISVLLLIVLTFSLSACNKSNNTSSELDISTQSGISSIDTSSQNNTTSNEDLKSEQSSSKEESKPQSSSESSSKAEVSKPTKNTSTVVAGEYTVTFDYGYDNKKITAKSQNYKVSKPEEPTRRGYEFLGWYAANETAQWNFSGHAVTNDMTLTAKWGKYRYNIFYSNVIDGAETIIMKKSEIEYNQTASMGQGIENPEKGKIVVFEPYSVAIKEDTGFVNGEICYSGDNFSSEYYEKYVFRVPDSFSVDTATFTIQELNLAGYTFLGWTYDGQATPVKTVTISKGTTKDYNIIANWKSK